METVNNNDINEDKFELVADLAFKILKEQIGINDIDNYPEEIKKEVINLLNNNSSFEYKTRLRVKICIDAIVDYKNFDLNEYVERDDSYYQFPFACPFNKKAEKAALGYILPDNAIYCDVPIRNNHADVVTQIHRMIDPDYEDLRTYSVLHPENRDWHEKVMDEEKCIIIHFMSNNYGAVIYIPNEITPFQEQELNKINDILTENNIKTVTNKDEISLSEYIEGLNDKKHM